MNTFELIRGGKRHLYSGPSTWAELSPRQAIGLMRLRLKAGEKPEYLFPALKLLYGIKPRQQRWLFDAGFLRRQRFSEEEIVIALDYGQRLLDMLNWVGEDDPEAVFLPRLRRYDGWFTTPLMALKRLFNRTLYAGPAFALSSSTFEEFMYAQRAFQQADLPLLAAILYRPMNRRPNAQGDFRQPLDLYQVEARAARFKAMNPALLQYIAFGFSCTQLELQRCFPLVFPKTTTEEDTAKKNKESGTWLDVAIGLAKLDVTKVRGIEQTNLYLALKVLNEQIRQDDQMKEALDQMKKK